jgi:hypothetical protein
VREHWERQRIFTRKVLAKLYHVRDELELTPPQLLDYSKEIALSLYGEVDELKNELPWKHHRLYDDLTLIKDNLIEEGVDIVKFVMSFLVAHGVTSEEFEEGMRIKSTVVEDRWRQEHEHPELKAPIALIDLDGVLNEFPGPFIDFVNETASRYFSTVEQMDAEEPLLKQQMKHLYRQSGLKRTLPEKMDSKIAVEMLAAGGYTILIMSQRPYPQYSRIYGDTLYWLGAHGIPYQRLIFVPSKGHKLMLSELKDKIAFAVDDDPDVVAALQQLGIKTYWLGGFTDHMGIKDKPVPGVDGSRTVGPSLNIIPITSMLQIPEVRATLEKFQQTVKEEAHGR